MTFSLKPLGLALFVSLVALGTAVPSASASEFTVEEKLYVVGTDTGAEDLFTTFGSEYSCLDEQITSESPVASTELTFAPTFTNCKTPGAAFNNVTITANGCDYLLKVTEAVETDRDHGTFSIACPVGKVIEIHRYGSEATHKELKSDCTTTIGAQSATGKVSYTSNTLADDIEAHGQLMLTAQSHGTCSFGFTLITTEAAYHFGMTLEAVMRQRLHVG